MEDIKFKEGDYIIKRKANDMAIVKGISKKGYYQFSVYYNSMFDDLYDLKNITYELQVNYQKFWDFCTDKEKEKFDKIIKKKGEN